MRENILIIRKKSDWISDADLVELYENRAKKIISRETIPHNAAEFHTRYFWSGSINFEVVNPEVDASWTPPKDGTGLLSHSKFGIKGRFRLFILRSIRFLFSQSARNAKLDILSLLRCPKCYSEQLERISANIMVCSECGVRYKMTSNIVHMNGV